MKWWEISGYSCSNNWEKPLKCIAHN